MAQTTIQGSFLGDGTVTGAKVAADFISAQTALASGLATADELIVSDAGVIKKIAMSVWAAATITLTNKSIDLGTNTLTGSVAEFNTALQSESFATLGGTETLVAKTLTTPTITSTGWTNATHAHGANNSGGTLDASVLGAGTVPVDRLSAASTGTAGIVELAIAGEVNTGTSDALAVTPDSLAGSIYGEKNIQMIVIDWTTALTTGSKFYFYVPATLDGFHVVSAHAAMITAPTGSAVLVDIEKPGLDNIFDTPMQIAAGTIVSIDSGSGVWTLDSTHKILATGQILRVDINQVGSSTAGSGLYINLTCRRP